MAYEGRVEISTNKGKVYLTREDGKSWIYDINSGVLLGLRGTPIIRFPFSYRTRATIKDDFSSLYWLRLCQYSVSYTVNEDFIESIAKLEKIYNIVKDRTLASNIYYQIPNAISEEKKLEYIQYCKKNGYIKYQEWDLICLKVKYKTLFEKYENLPHYNDNIIYELLKYYPSLAPYYNDALRHWLLNGMWSIRNASDFFGAFKNIIEEMEKYNIPYEYNRNFPLWYSQMKDTVKVRKNLELDRKFYNAKQNMPNLYYSNEKYEVIIPNSIEEYRTEARAMNNCIERIYLEKVANGETYIVFIRDKANINTPLVDCEIKPNGIINQFLKKNNCSVFSGDELADFHTEYQNHLINNIFNK